MPLPEILAPCGSMENLIAAVRCGADAVYLGTKEFNARKNAGNFSHEELAEAVKYCHAHGVKVHITFNTLVTDEEILLAEKELKHICACGADVLILQDLGLAKIAKHCAPDIARHASTQMSVQTAEGMNLLENLGYCRAVLPRETSKNEIKKIRSRTNIELEAFVHGALCMCVSGQCYLSAMLGSRSGNRGLCAQPCRLPFAAKNGTGNDLSLKDLSLIEKADQLAELGVCSLKIEGRMKRPEYVAAAVTSLKNSLHGKEDKSINSALSAVFSRSGFTDGYFEGKRGRDMFGIRRKEDVVSADKATFSMLAELYSKEVATVPVEFFITIRENEPLSLAAKCGKYSVFVENPAVPQKAINKPTTEEMVCEKLSKCGGTMFFAQSIECDMDKALAVPVSAINALRRQALEELQAKMSDTAERRFVPYNLQLKERQYSPKKPKLFIRIADTEQLPDNFDDVSAVAFPLGKEAEILERLPSSVTAVVEIPRGIFDTDDIIAEKLIKAKESGISNVLCSTLDAVALAKKAGLKIHGGFGLNVFNSVSVEVLEELGLESITLSPELKINLANKMYSNKPLGIIGYGNLPLMLTRNCPVKNGTTCDKCNSSGYLTDRKGIKFPVVCNNGCSELLNSRPIYLADKLSDIKLDFLTLYFTKESKEEVESIIHKYKNGERYKNDGEVQFTRGLYLRGVE